MSPFSICFAGLQGIRQQQVSTCIKASSKRVQRSNSRKQILLGILRVATSYFVTVIFEVFFGLVTVTIEPSMSMFWAIPLGVFLSGTANHFLAAKSPFLQVSLSVIKSSLGKNVIVNDWFEMLALCGIIPATEEFFFRGVIFLSCSHFTGFFIAAIIQSAWFTSNHSDSLGSLRFLRGLVYCLVYYLSGSIFAAIICHCINNILAYIQVAVASAELETEQNQNKYICNLCSKVLRLGQHRYNCTSCIIEINLCETCFKTIGTHKKGHKMEKELVYEYVPPKPYSCVAQAIHNSFLLYRDRPCLGEASLEHGDNEYHWQTYQQVYNRIHDIGMGLSIISTKPDGIKIAICGYNSIDWILAEFAVFLFGYTLVPLPSTKNLKSLKFILSETLPEVIFCEDGFTEVITQACQGLGGIKFLFEWKPKTLVPTQTTTKYSPNLGSLRDSSMRLKNSGGISKSDLVVQTFASLEQSGHRRRRDLEVADRFKFHERNSSDLICIVYTSGSSGQPKGVEWTDAILNQSTTEKIEIVPLVVPDFQPPEHAFSLRMNLRVWGNGGRIGVFNRGDNLFERFPKLRPTLVAATPAFWNSISNDFKFRLGQAQKKGDTTPNVTKRQLILQTQHNAILGNRVRMIISGGAFTSPSVRELIKEIFVVPVSDGYAATEAGTILVNGSIPPSVDVLLCSFETGSPKVEKDYGEICVCSATVISGYFNNPTLNKNSFIEVNQKKYFRTGDVGKVNPDNSISIVDRASSILKLAQGEFVAPEKLEALYETNPNIRQIFITGSVNNQFLVAVVVPSLALKSLKENHNAKVLSILSKTAKKNSLASWETPIAVYLEENEFSIENGFLTATLKKRRQGLKEFYASVVQRLSAQTSFGCDVANPFKQVPEIFQFLQSVVPHINLELCFQEAFSQLGGDSLAALQFLRLVSQNLGVEMSFSSFLKLESMEEVEKVIFSKIQNPEQTQTPQKPIIDWNSEVLLPKEFEDQFISEESKLLTLVGDKEAELIERQDIFMTGATGYLGPYLLNQIISTYILPNQSPVKPHIYCLVRDSITQTAQQRFESNCRRFLMWNDLVQQHVTVISGDLKKSKFGLSDDQWADLALRTTIIFHNAAQVNGVLSYSQLKKANVGSTIQILQLGVLCRPKTIHHISSINVLRPADDHPEIPMTLTQSKLQLLDSMPGYAQTKFISEVILNSAISNPFWRSNLKNLFIYRSATISAHTSSGCCNVSDWTNIVISGLIQLGVYPRSGKGLPVQLLLTPVDFVSRAICGLSTLFPNMTSCPDTPNIFHLVCPTPIEWSRIVEYISAYGFVLKPCSDSEWATTIKNMDKENPLYMFQDVLMFGTGFDGVSYNHGPSIALTQKHLKALNLECPEISEEMFFRQLDFMSSTQGNLPKPLQKRMVSKVAFSNEVLESQYYRCENWYQDLKDWTFATNFIPLGSQEAQVLKELRHEIRTSTFEDLALKKSTGASEPREFVLRVSEAGLSPSGRVQSSFNLLSQNATDEDTQAQAAWMMIIGKWKTQKPDLWSCYQKMCSEIDYHIQSMKDGAFVKLSSRSPKDSLSKSSQLKTTLTCLLKENPGIEEHAVPVHLTRAMVASMKVTSSQHVLWSFLNSDRIAQDLRQCQLSNAFPISIAVRQFVSFKPEFEFRAFILDGNMTSCTQYHSLCFVPEIVKHKTKISILIYEFWSTIKENIKCKDYSIDFLVLPVEEKVIVIELNYPPPIASTCLFNWADPADREAVQSGPFQIRVLEQPIQNVFEFIEPPFNQWIKPNEQNR